MGEIKKGSKQKEENLRKSMFSLKNFNEEFAFNMNIGLSPLVIDPMYNNYTLIKTNYSLVNFHLNKDEAVELMNDSSISLFQSILIDYKNVVFKCIDNQQILIFLGKGIIFNH